jgi:segregation and condensation protein B
MDFLQNHIESIIFCAQEPVKIEEIRQTLSEMFEAEVPEEDVVNAVEALLTKYESENYSFQIYKISNGFQFLTKPAYQSSLSIFLKQKSKKRLSTSALETIAIIAYKQPITKTEIEQIRGVNCDYAIQKLLEKELIDIKGKSEGVGRPILYGTSSKFMEYFGINSLRDLPTIKDYTSDQNMIGEVNDPSYVASENESSEQQEETVVSEMTAEIETEVEIENEASENLPDENDSPENETGDLDKDDNEQETL